MFITALAAAAVAIWGFSRSVFMTGPYQFYYRFALALVLIILFLFFTGRRWLKHHRIRQLQVDYKEYMYFDQFTSLIYRAGYLISYLVMNIIFDYNYMRRNFNFCKGLDVYDGGVADYYIKFRNTWYKYLILALKRHKASVKKLQSYAAQMKNNMILNAMEDDGDKLMYIQFARDAEAAFEEKQVIGEHILMPLDNYEKIHPYYKDNIIRILQARLYLSLYEPEIIEMVKLMEKHGKLDVADYKKMKF